MSTIQRSNNKLHIGEGPSTPPKFIGEVSSLIDDSSIIINDTDELIKPVSGTASTDIPTELVLDPNTGESFGFIKGTHTVIRYSTAGVASVCHINNVANIQTLGLYRPTDDSPLFLMVVDYIGSSANDSLPFIGSKIFYKRVDRLDWDGEYADFLHLDVDFQNVKLSYAENTGVGGSSTHPYLTNSDYLDNFDNNNYVGHLIPQSIRSNFSAGLWLDDNWGYGGMQNDFNKTAHQATIRNRWENMTHFLSSANESLGNKKQFFRITQLTYDSVNKNSNEQAGNQNKLYLQIAPLGGGAVNWRDCVIFKAHVVPSGDYLSPINESNGLEPQFAPLFYLGCPDNIDIDNPVKVKTNQEFWHTATSINENILEEFETFSSQGIYENGEQTLFIDEQPISTETHEIERRIQQFDYVVDTPFGPIMRMMQKVLTNEFSVPYWGQEIQWHSSGYRSRYSLVDNGEVQIAGQYQNQPDRISPITEKRVEPSSDWIDANYTAQQLDSYKPWDGFGSMRVQMGNQEYSFFNDFYTGSIHSIENDDYVTLNGIDDSPFSEYYFNRDWSNDQYNIGEKTKELFKTRFTKNIFCSNIEEGVKYPKKAISFNRNKNVNIDYPDLNISFMIQSDAAIYKHSAVQWGTKGGVVGQRDEAPLNALGAAYTDGVYVGNSSGNIVVTVPAVWSDNETFSPFGLQQLDYMGVNESSQPENFEIMHGLDVSVEVNENSASIKHILLEKIDDDDYGIPSYTEAYNAPASNSLDNLTRNDFIGENGQSVKYAPSTNSYTIIRGSHRAVEYIISPDEEYEWDHPEDHIDSVNVNAFGEDGAIYFWDTLFGMEAISAVERSFVDVTNVGGSWAQRLKDIYDVLPARRLYDVNFLASAELQAATNETATYHQISMPSSFYNIADIHTDAELSTSVNYFDLEFIGNHWGLDDDKQIKMLMRDVDTNGNSKIFYSGFLDVISIQNSSFRIKSDNSPNSIADITGDGIVLSLETTQSSDGDDLNFIGSCEVEYRASFLYDNFQEGPLSFVLAKESIAAGTNKDYINVKVTFDAISIPPRVTHINIYKKYIKTDGSGDVMSKFLHSQILRPLLNLNVENDTRYSFNVNDYNAPAASYDAIVGISETVKDHGVRYGISAISDSYLFVADPSITFDPEGDYSNYIFRSMPNGRFSQFNWPVDYVRLEDKPVALATYNGRLFAFTETKLFVINQGTLEVENTFHGVGCLGNNAVISTQYGLCFVDYNNIYLMQDGAPQIISSTISKKIEYTPDSTGDNFMDIHEDGWQIAGDILQFRKININISFDNQRKSFLIFFTVKDSENTSIKGNFCWAYNLIYKRWDLLSSPLQILGTFITKSGRVLLSGITNDSSNHSRFSWFLQGLGTKEWSWHSKKMNFGASTQDKRLKSVKIGSNKNLSTLYSTATTTAINLYKDRADQSTNKSMTTEANSEHDFTTEIKLLADKKFKNLQIQFNKLSGQCIIDNIGIVFIPKRPK